MSEPTGTKPDLPWHACMLTLRALFSVSARPTQKFYAPLPEQGFILATNHVSHFDPPLLTFPFPRMIDWIAIKELFHGPILTRLFQALNVIPIDRHGADRAALRTASKRLALGRVVGIFPEGGIRDGAHSILNGAPLKGGVSVLAQLTGAPIVPGVIIGSDRLYNRRRWLPWSPAPVWMGFGSPVELNRDLPREEQRADLEARLARAYTELKDRLTADFHLTAADLPQPPRERMTER